MIRKQIKQNSSVATLQGIHFSLLFMSLRIQILRMSKILCKPSNTARDSYKIWTWICQRKSSLAVHSICLPWITTASRNMTTYTMLRWSCGITALEKDKIGRRKDRTVWSIFKKQISIVWINPKEKYLLDSLIITGKYLSVREYDKEEVNQRNQWQKDSFDHDREPQEKSNSKTSKRTWESYILRYRTSTMIPIKTNSAA